MAYDEGLAERMREVLGAGPGLEEKRMFGGVCFLLNGNMACGVHKDYLISRVGLKRGDKALTKPNALPFDITGRAMKGWVMVEAEGYESDKDLKQWVKWGMDEAASLPPKAAKKKAEKKTR